jgi:hypothetical protein
MIKTKKVTYNATFAAIKKLLIKFRANEPYLPDFHQ